MALMLGLQKLIISSLPAQVMIHPIPILAGKVSPSAVWYTSLDFVRSGFMRMNLGTIQNLGITGFYWSSVTRTYNTHAANVFRLVINDLAVNPSSYDSRYYGFPVRCLVY